MRRAFFLLLSFGFATATAPLAFAGDDRVEDLKFLQGTWVIDPLTYQDEKDKDRVKELAALKVIFADDMITFEHRPGNTEKGPFRLVPWRNPKQINLLSEIGTLQAQGIYELDGDNLKLCWDRQFKTRGRPIKFSKGASGGEPFLLVLVREKN
jgi:uncharacterized protein (TIGR03067 family)